MTTTRAVGLIAMGTFAGAGLLLAGWQLARAWSPEPLCGNDILSEHLSPDRALRVVVFKRDCGATTGFSVQASVLPADQKLEGAGNIFVADDNHSAADVRLNVQWRTPNEVSLDYDPALRIYRAETEWRGLRIRHLSQR